MTEKEIHAVNKSMLDWQNKIMSAIHEGNIGQMAAAMNAEVNLRILLLADRIEKLEKANILREPIR